MSDVASGGVDTDSAFFAHLSEDERDLYREVSDMAREVFASIAEKGREGHVNRQLVKALGDEGLLGRLFDNDDTDGDVSSIEICLIREALALHSTEAETAFGLQALGAYPVLQAGSAELTTQWIPRVARGEAVAAFALTEPNAGSDVASMEMRAARTDGGYLLSGVKTYISNAPEADFYTIFASTDQAAKSRGVTAFLMPADSPGLTGTALKLLSPHPIGRLELDEVFVPDEQVLGEVNSGFKVAMRTLDLLRPSVGAFTVGIAQAALDAATSHAAERQAFGRYLKEFQGVSHQLADLATRTQAARVLVHAAARARDRQLPQATVQVAMAKLYATETAQQAVDLAIQVHGARALEEGHLLEHLYREVRAPRIYEGASEVQREIIARGLFKARV